jgi:hypothetical protein
MAKRGQFVAEAEEVRAELNARLPAIRPREPPAPPAAETIREMFDQQVAVTSE